MRRMYSVKELSEIIYSVVGKYIEDGAFDETIEGYILDYIAEHPIDPTAITGLDIAPKDVTASGNITGASIIENMSGYSLAVKDDSFTNAYIGVVKNGNKITVALAGTFTPTSAILSAGIVRLARINIPASVFNKLVPIWTPNILAVSQTLLFTSQTAIYPTAWKVENNYSNALNINLITQSNEELVAETAYSFRIEMTFLLGENLVV